MSGLTQAVRSFRNIWSHGDDDFNDDEVDYNDEPDDNARTNAKNPANARPAETSYAASAPNYGGAGSSGVRRLRSVAPSQRAREKNIYTLRPKTQEDAAIAADALKSGDAVIINLEEVERAKAVRIIDFMSGVCYGLEGQGHAMKLGDLIFLYTPPEFEICSDETDYGENPDFFFRDVEQPKNAATSGAAVSSATVQNVGAPTVSSAPLGAQFSNLRAAALGQTPPANSHSSAGGQPIPSQQLPSQTLPPQTYGSTERRPWER